MTLSHDYILLNHYYYTILESGRIYDIVDLWHC